MRFEMHSTLRNALACLQKLRWKYAVYSAQDSVISSAIYDANRRTASTNYVLVPNSHGVQVTMTLGFSVGVH